MKGLTLLVLISVFAVGIGIGLLACASSSGDDDDSTDVADADDDSDDDGSCASCETTGECTEALGLEWGCVDGCCVFYGDDGDDDGDDDDDDYSPEECTDILSARANEDDCYWIDESDIEFACSGEYGDADCVAECFVSEDDCEDAVGCVGGCGLGIGGPTEEEEFEHFCGEDTNHDDVTDGDFSGRVVLVQPQPVLDSTEQDWQFIVCNMTPYVAGKNRWIGYFKLRLPNQDWEFVVPVPRPDPNFVGEWTTDGPQNTDGIAYVEWEHVTSPSESSGDIREREYLTFDVPLVSASIVVPGDSFEFALKSGDGAGNFSASGSVAIQ